MGYHQNECILCYLCDHCNVNGIEGYVCAICINEAIKSYSLNDFNSGALDKKIVLGKFRCDVCGEDQMVGFNTMVCSKHMLREETFTFTVYDNYIMARPFTDKIKIHISSPLALGDINIKHKIMEETRKVCSGPKVIHIIFTDHSDYNFSFTH